MSNIKFKYYRDVLNNAIFTDKKCEICGSEEFCLDGAYFEYTQDVEAVCLKCLKAGKIVVDIPQYLIDRITSETSKIYEDKAEKRKRIGIIVDELRRTPPVPWIQNNDWQICCNDFMEYIGEWDKEEIIVNSECENPREYLMNIMEESFRNRIDNVDYFWEEIGYDVAIFVFKCIHCSKYTAVWQSY